MNVALHKTVLSRHAFRYTKEATLFVVDRVSSGVLLAQLAPGPWVSRSPEAHGAVLSALFCHLRINPPEQPVDDFAGELADSIGKRKISNVLEVGPGLLPLWEHLQPLVPEANFYALGLDGVDHCDSSRHFQYKRGDMLQGIRSFFGVEFDLILSAGVHCSGGMKYSSRESSIKMAVAAGNQSAVDLTQALSPNPYAAFLAASFWEPFISEDILFFEKTSLEQAAEVLLWNELPIKDEESLYHPLFKINFQTQPANFTVLARKRLT